MMLVFAFMNNISINNFYHEMRMKLKISKYRLEMNENFHCVSHKVFPSLFLFLLSAIINKSEQSFIFKRRRKLELRQFLSDDLHEKEFLSLLSCILRIIAKVCDDYCDSIMTTQTFFSYLFLPPHSLLSFKHDEECRLKKCSGERKSKKAHFELKI